MMPMRWICLAALLLLGCDGGATTFRGDGFALTVPAGFRTQTTDRFVLLSSRADDRLTMRREATPLTAIDPATCQALWDRLDAEDRGLYQRPATGGDVAARIVGTALDALSPPARRWPWDPPRTEVLPAGTACVVGDSDVVIQLRHYLFVQAGVLWDLRCSMTPEHFSACTDAAASLRLDP